MKGEDVAQQMTLCFRCRCDRKGRNPQSASISHICSYIRGRRGTDDFYLHIHFFIDIRSHRLNSKTFKCVYQVWYGYICIEDRKNLSY